MKRLLIAGVLLLSSCSTPESGEPRPLPTPVQPPTQEGTPVTIDHRSTQVHTAIPDSIEIPETTVETPLDLPVSVQSVAPGYQCPELVETALSVGWSKDHIDRLDTVLWRESRCQLTAYNSTDPNGGSYGASQVNGFWCRPSRYSPDGWLQEQGIVKECADLYDPDTNLLAALTIFRYSQSRNGCGWSPWATKGSKWC